MGRLNCFHILCFLVLTGPSAFAAQSGLSYQGKIIKPDGNPLESSATEFRLQIRTAGSESCLMFEEFQTVNMAGSGGVFNISINDGQGTRLDSNPYGPGGLPYTLDQVFANRGTFTFPTPNCASGSGASTNWSPNVADGRKLQVYFRETSSSSWEPLPISNINFVPMAIEAKQIGGLTTQNLLRVDDPVLGPQSVSALTAANHTELVSLIGGTSSQYTKANELRGAPVPALSANQGIYWNGSAWTAYSPMASNSAASGDLTGNYPGPTVAKIQNRSIASTAPTDGQTLTWNNSLSQWEPKTPAATGITSLNGLSGATQTFANGSAGAAPAFSSSGSTHTLNIPFASASGVTAGVISKTEYDTFNQKLSASLNNGDIWIGNASSAPVARTLSGDASISNTGSVTVSRLQGYSVSSAAPTNGQILTWNNGQTRWEAQNPPSGADNLGNHTATQNFKTSGFWMSNDGDNEGVFVLSDGKVGVATSTPGSALDVKGTLRLSGSTSGYVGFAPAAAAGTTTYTLPSGDGSAGQVLSTNGLGVLSWASAGGGSGDFKADGTVPMTGAFLSTSGTAAAPAMSFNGDTNMGIFRPAADTLAVSTNGSEKMRVESGGNVGIGTTSPGSALDVKGTLRLSGSTSGYVGFAPAAAAGTTVYTLPSGDGTSGQVLSTNGLGVLSWASAGGGSGDFKADGTVPMTGPFLSTSGTAAAPAISFNGDTNMGIFRPAADALAVSTNGSEKMRVLSGGNVGIGTTNPRSLLHVNGEAQVGNTGLACGTNTKGAMRYNTGTNAMEFCNATSWVLLQASACNDAIPATISFTNLTNQSTSTLVTSDIVQVTGVNCVVSVQISGAGSPAFRTCSDAACTTVIQSWTTSPASLSSGDYLQLRLTSPAIGGTTNTATVLVGGGATAWNVSSTGSCAGLPGSPPPIGTVCADGTIYVGTTPDGGVPMYATRCDYGQTWNGTTCTGAAIMTSFNNGASPTIQKGYSNLVTGATNTANWAGLSNAESPYYAPKFCNDLVEAGQSDWYLPGRAELIVVYNAGVLNSAEIYWSSTEDPSDTDVYQVWGIDGGYYDQWKNNNNQRVRCVRK